MDKTTDIANFNYLVNNLQKSKVKEVNGVCYVLKYDLTDQEKSIVSTMSGRKDIYENGCRACMERALAYSGLMGEEKPMLFGEELHPIRCKLMDDLKGIQQSICNIYTKKPKALLVKKTTFKNKHEGTNIETGRKYYHLTVIPNNVTADTLSQRMTKLWHMVDDGMDTRLKTLMSVEGRNTVEIIKKVTKTLKRQEYWEHILRWLDDIYRRYEGEYDTMTDDKKIEVKIFALSIGNCHEDLHKTFKQAGTLTGFFTYDSVDNLRRMMDEITDPRNYLQSQLTRKMEKNNVTSDLTIGLTWDGKYTDDLDLHVFTPNGTEIYFGRKTGDGCTLDFDANVSRGEKEPCENVSCKNNGRYNVYVNNYTRRTFNEIPFTVVIKEKGKNDISYNEVWSRHRKNGDKMRITTFHYFKTECDSGLTMSDKSINRSKQYSDEWDEKIGNPECHLTTLDELNEYDVEYVLCNNPSKDVKTGKDVNELFKSISMRDDDNKNVKRRKYLSEHCNTNIKTVDELFELLKTSNKNITIENRDHTPGYMTTIRTKTSNVRKNIPGLCHYNEKYKVPVKPFANMAIGNARLDTSWYKTSINMNHYVEKIKVYGMVKVGTMYFMIMDDGRLPEYDYPLSGGFYGVDLTDDYHKHREKWTFFNTQMKPTCNQNTYRSPSPNKEMIGTFLVGRKTVVYMDGKRYELV
jgi:hypothetical protein